MRLALKAFGHQSIHSELQEYNKFASCGSPHLDEKRRPPTVKPLHYKRSFFYRPSPNTVNAGSAIEEVSLNGATIPDLIADFKWGKVALMTLKQLYQDIYQKFLEKKEGHQGYDFQQSPVGSATPPAPTFQENVKWWTLNRPSRLQKIREIRDQQQQDILNLKSPPPAKP